LPLVRSYFLCDLLDMEPMLTRDTECRKLIDEAMKYFILKVAE